MNIIRIVEENSKKLNAKVVHEIELDIGELSGVDIDALILAMKLTEKQEFMENSRFIINRIPAITKCNKCKLDFQVSNLYSACPYCNSYDNSIISGKELNVKTILID